MCSPFRRLGRYATFFHFSFVFLKLLLLVALLGRLFICVQLSERPLCGLLPPSFTPSVACASSQLGSVQQTGPGGGMPVPR
uniref:Putative secreted protein n=1 Tax=Ixodes ricinus TaxID=34613 RepID=A0A6B0U842_IXORI